MKKVSFSEKVHVVEIPRYVKDHDFVSHLESYILMLRLNHRRYLADKDKYLKNDMVKIVNAIVFHKDVSSIVIHRPIINKLKPFVDDFFKLLEFKFRIFKDVTIITSEYTNLIVFRYKGSKKCPCIDEELSLYNV